MALPMTGGTDFRVTPEEVSAAAANTENSAVQITDELAVLRQYVVNLEGAWLGIAANSFQSLMNDYDVYAKMLTQALTDIAAGLRGNYVNYSSSEESNISNLTAVNGAIPGANFH